MAADVLLAVDAEGAYANLLLPRLLRERSITGTDAAFATELGYGALRRAGGLDAVISAGASRDAASLDPPVRAVLRLGAYQLLHTRVPPHAAVSTSVDLVRELAGGKPAGLVNAVLRRVGERDWDAWVARLAPADDALGRRAFEQGYPRWVAAALLEALDGDHGELERALTDERPVTHLAATPGLISRDNLLAAAGDGATPGPWSPYAVRLAGGDPGGLEPIRDGRAAVQDEGSQLVALALSRADVAGRDRWWLDACAGPGGKSRLLGGLLPNTATLIAAEQAPHRARLVAAATARLPRTFVVVADSTRPSWREGSFDRVLVDAPCTGLGALRRRPEARWRREPSDVGRLQQLQCDLLAAALEVVRVGGVVGYATCSPHPAETTAVVHRVLSGSAAELLDAPACLPGVPDLGDGRFVQLWPHRHGTDAMFLALIRRTA